MPRRALYLVKMDLWREDLEARNYPRTTVRTKLNGVRCAWEWGRQKGWEQDPKKITPANVRDYLEHLRRYASNTQASYGTSLLLFLRWAGNKNLDEFHLRIRVERSRVDWLSVEEMSAIIASAPSLQVRMMEIMFAYTGIRLSELANLRLKDLHEDHLMVNMGKCSKSRRVPLTKNFWEAVDEYMLWRRTRPGEMLMAYPDPKPGQSGEYTTNGMAHAIRNHWKALDRHISPHTFRRSFGRHLYKAGMPIVEIQRLYGHTRPEVTISYLGIQDEDLASSLTKFQPRY